MPCFRKVVRHLLSTGQDLCLNNLRSAVNLVHGNVESSFMDADFGSKKTSKALSCKIDLESDRRFKAIAASSGRSPSEYLREIVYEKLGELESGRRKFDRLSAEIDALRHDFTSAISSLRRDLGLGPLGWSFPQRTPPCATVKKGTKAKENSEGRAPADANVDGWERRDRRRRLWGRW